MERARYQTDLTDREWIVIEPMIPEPKQGGRPRDTNIREVLNGIFYITKTGAQWRMLPTDFPPWQTVYGYYYRWRKDGTWLTIHDELRAEVRQEVGKDEQATAAIIDSQSVKCSEESAKDDKG
jgi:putative transposase